MKNKIRILCLTGVVFLALSSLFSCTYDYFVDDSNIRIQVKELVTPNSNVENVLVVVLDENDNYQASVFVKDPSALDGYSAEYVSTAQSAYNVTAKTIHFKVPQYSNSVYKIACFANIDPDAYSKSNSPYIIWQPVSDTLRTGMPNLRTAFRRIIPPIGYSTSIEYFNFTNDDGSSLVDSLDYRARITCSFREIPEELNIDRIKVQFKSSTDMYYSGGYALGLSSDYSAYTWMEYEYADISLRDETTLEGKIVKVFYPQDIIKVFPSPGNTYLDSSNGKGFHVRAFYYSGDNMLVSSVSTEVPGGYFRDSDGIVQTAAEFNLKPEMDLNILFDGFDEITITIDDWDDVIEGPSIGV